MTTTPSEPQQDPDAVPSGDPHREPDGLPEWDPEQGPPDAEVKPGDVAQAPTDPGEDVGVDPPTDRSDAEPGQMPESTNPEVGA